jgi:hypothetical protein
MPHVLCILAFSLLALSGAEAHSVEYQVENRGISARFFFLPNDPASYSAHKIFGPGDTARRQKGRSDSRIYTEFITDFLLCHSIVSQVRNQERAYFRLSLNRIGAT